MKQLAAVSKGLKSLELNNEIQKAKAAYCAQLDVESKAGFCSVPVARAGTVAARISSMGR